MHVIMGTPEQLLQQGHYDEAELAGALLDHYYAHLHYLAYSLLDDQESAHDIVQETILIALEKISHYQPGTDLKAWLSRITIYRCRTALRRRAVREKWYLVWSKVAMLGASPKTPEKYTEDDQLRGELWRAVDNLGARHRLPVILHYVHGLTAPEIAELLEIREGTVYSRLYYACRKLAGQFSNSDLEAWAEELLNE
jgi:RNA polymerase sigma-70 factor (ECF subfamily)